MSGRRWRHSCDWAQMNEVINGRSSLWCYCVLMTFNRVRTFSTFPKKWEIERSWFHFGLKIDSMPTFKNIKISSKVPALWYLLKYQNIQWHWVLRGKNSSHWGAAGYFRWASCFQSTGIPTCPTSVIYVICTAPIVLECVTLVKLTEIT